MISRARLAWGRDGRDAVELAASPRFACSPFRNGSATSRLDAALKYTTTTAIVVDDTAV